MRPDLVPGDPFPDPRLPDHTGSPRKLSLIADHKPLLLAFVRGWWCPLGPPVPGTQFVTTVDFAGGTRQFAHGTGGLVAPGTITQTGTVGTYAGEYCLRLGANSPLCADVTRGLGGRLGLCGSILLRLKGGEPCIVCSSS